MTLTPRLLLHAGASNSWADDGGKRKEDVEEALRNVALAGATDLKAGKSALDVAQHVELLEDCPLFNAGKGSVLTKSGEHELEAALVDSAAGAYGAVTCVRHLKDPIRGARAVMEGCHHCVLSGSAADDYSSSLQSSRVPNDFFTTDVRRQHWEACQSQKTPSPVDLETVGAVVLDSHGNLAAAGSTGGMTNKLNGRIGDTAILGAGLWADKRVAMACSGNGDDILCCGLASMVAASYEQQQQLEKAVRSALKGYSALLPSAAIIAMDSKGQISIQSTARVFFTASYGEQASPTVQTVSNAPRLSEQHISWDDVLEGVYLTRNPLTKDHAILHTKTRLFSLQREVFVDMMMKVARKTSAALCTVMGYAVTA